MKLLPHRLTLVLITALVTLLLAACGTTGTTPPDITYDGQVADPAGDGDPSDLDVVSVRWYDEGDDIVFEIELTTSEMASGFLSLDMDQNTGTGVAAEAANWCPDAPAAAYEAEIDIFDGSATVYEPGSAVDLGAVTPSLEGKVTTIRFPIAWIDGDTEFDLYSIIGDDVPSDCILD